MSAAVPRDSATVLLLRDGPAGVEVYLMRRVRGMPFAGGMTAYPGGSVDPRDAEPGLAWIGPPPAAWAAAFGAEEPTARALVCAGVRETFEETGVLLAGRPGAAPVVADTAEWDAVRRALHGGELSLAQALTVRGLAVRADLLRPWAHWVTPEVEPRRYDTWFFAAALPAGQRARDVSGEAETAGWLRPAAALTEYEDGARPMLPPTVHTLRDLVPHRSVASVLAAAPPGRLDVVRPLLVEHGGVQWVQLPDGSRVRPPVRLGPRPEPEPEPGE
ncbi:MAG: NUDIX hydrolase [Actinobacteria bacterium]|nr:NUDIX hydrolase [Actinomycetota bacterium]MBI3686387.1 NUDIX hydrolase [Actinomycetota bacterium]